VSLPRHRTTARRTGLLAGLASSLVTLSLLPVQAQAQTQAQSQTQTQAQASPWPGHPDRAVVRHVVRPGDTATGLAVRFHAWTAELIRLNGLGAHGRLRQGQVIRIPVVLSAVRRAGGTPPAIHGKQAEKGKKVKRHRTPAWLALHRTRPPGRGWLHADLTRDQVRRLVIRTARQLGVPPRLALAVAWQESGWRQRRVSSTGALGVMQVMPDTGRWMRWYVGRPLRLRDTHDNVLAGVMTLKVLRAWTTRDRNAIAAYYQGLGAVRRHGYFEDTKLYVAAVRAHQRRIASTGSPV
jgi:LysM repeat protein